jgi:malate synthase
VLLDDAEIPEGILDAMVTGLIAHHDLKGLGRVRNSRAGSVYIVKPKMHGPEEVAFAGEVFASVEDALNLPRHTLKIGIMDEERRTTVNLAECIRAAKDRVIFINTGFLDRTGDEIHTSMEAGPMVPKAEMKNARWILAYEDWNVDTGLACGFSGKAQIGKGMWAMPDRMRQMVETKQIHPLAGANCAWVPSPTAATLHAMHYHDVDVFARQTELMGQKRQTWTPADHAPAGAKTERRRDPARTGQQLPGHPRLCRALDGSGHRLLQGAGHQRCRADGRPRHPAHFEPVHRQLAAPRPVHVGPGSRHAGAHGDRGRSPEQDDPAYHPMAPDFAASVAFQAARDLIFKGKDQPSGYARRRTEPILHEGVAQVKFLQKKRAVSSPLLRHDDPASRYLLVISEPIPPWVNISNRMTFSTRPSRMWALPTPPSTASRQHLILGIIPPVTTPCSRACTA